MKTRDGLAPVGSRGRLGGSTFLYLGDWAVQSTFVAATCLVLAAQEKTLPTGQGGVPVSRAEITVHVFNTAAPECCCPGTDGAEKCAEWQAVAFDSARLGYLAGFTPTDKRNFIHEFGHPGNFQPCWHSRNKDQVILDRDWNLEMLALPALAGAASLAAALAAGQRVCTAACGWRKDAGGAERAEDSGASGGAALVST